MIFYFDERQENLEFNDLLSYKLTFFKGDF